MLMPGYWFFLLKFRLHGHVGAKTYLDAPTC